MPRKKDFPGLEFRCDRCGALAEKDEERSTEQWTAYSVLDCACGGRFVVRMKERTDG